MVVACAERRARLERQLHALAAQAGGRVVADEHLLDTLAEIVEWPTIIVGALPRILPDPAQGSAGDLPGASTRRPSAWRTRRASCCPASSPPPTARTIPSGFIKSGNEWVLRARLYDARFFFEEDRKQPARGAPGEAQAPHLPAGAGQLLRQDPAHRRPGLGPGRQPGAGRHRRAGWWPQACKCDLVTLMVGEFPELQGIMGGEYLRREGAHEKVWMAVKEHYRPCPPTGPIPSTPLGGVLAIADKLDTVAGLLRHRPGAHRLQGSPGPAPGRAGHRAHPVRAGLEPGSPAHLPPWPWRASATRPPARPDETLEALEAFFRDRVAFQLEQAGYPGPVRRSALAAGLDRPGGPQGPLRGPGRLRRRPPVPEPGPERQAHRQHPQGRGPAGPGRRPRCRSPRRRPWPTHLAQLEAEAGPGPACWSDLAGAGRARWRRSSPRCW